MTKMNKLLIANAFILVSLLVLTSAFSPLIIKAFESLLPVSVTLITVSPESGLVSLFFASLAITLIVYIPIAIVSLYFYIRPALYYKEIAFMKNSVLLGIGLFLIGTGFGFFSYLTFGIPFFVWANKLLGIANYWSIAALVSQTLMASLAVGVAFLFPIVLNNMIHYDLVKVEALKKRRVLFAVVLAIIIVLVPFLPNNPLEQAAIFLPIYSMFEATIFLNRNRVSDGKALAAPEGLVGESVV